MKLLLAILFISVGFRASAENTPEQIKAIQPHYLYAAEFMNNFKTIDQYLNGLREFNLITQAEYNGIIQTLKDKDVSTQANLVMPKVTGQELKFGKNTLVYKDEKTFQTKDGVYIRLGDNESADLVFTKTLKAFEPQKTSSRFNLIVSTAYAQNSVTDAVSSGLFTLGYHGIKAFGTFMAAAGGGAANFLGIILDPLVVSISNLIHKGTVKCTYEGGYTLDAGFNYVSWQKAYAEGVKLYNFKMPGSSPSIADGAGGYSSSVAGFAKAGVEMLGNGVLPDANGVLVVSASGLKLAWPHGKAPVCDEKNAAILQKAIKEKATIVKTELYQIVLKIKATKAAPISKPKDSKSRQ